MNNIAKRILNYRVFGNGHPVVFLHGFLESMTMWEGIEIKGRWQYVYIDLAGHGDSELVDEVISMKSMADDVDVVLNIIGIESYHLVAHSMGGYVALELLKATNKIKKLVLLNSNFWADSLQKKVERERVARIVLKNKSLFIYEVIPNLFIDPETKNDRVINLIHEANNMIADDIAKISIAISQRNDNTNLVSENRKSILIIQGGKDTVVPYSIMKKVTECHKLKVIVFPEAGHMIHIENPERLTKELSNFFSNTSKVQ